MRFLYGMRAITETQERSCLVLHSFLSVFPMLAESQTLPLSFPGTSGLLLVWLCKEFHICFLYGYESNNGDPNVLVLFSYVFPMLAEYQNLPLNFLSCSCEYSLMPSYIKFGNTL